MDLGFDKKKECTNNLHVLQSETLCSVCHILKHHVCFYYAQDQAYKYNFCI